MRSLSLLREFLLRLLSEDEVDFLGISRKLLLDRSGRPDALEWLRDLGFVHLVTASGIHLYLLADRVDQAVRSFAELFGLPVRIGLRLSGLAQLAGWAWIWALSDFRPGLLRPLLLVGLRHLARSRGLRWRTWSPLLIALLADLLLELGRVAFLDASFEPEGRLHYALAVGGGLVGYEWAKDRPAWLRHLALAWCSWVFTAGWQLFAEGSVSPWTPLL